MVGALLDRAVTRLPQHAPLFGGTSACASCGKPVRPGDAIPLVSFVALGGRCRHCKGRIPWRHPIVEAGTALFFVLVLATYGATRQGVLAAIFLAVLWGTVWTDLEHRIVPNALVLFGFVVTAALIVPEGVHGWANHLAGLFLLGGATFLLALVSRGGFGGGDVKLTALTGFVLGPAGGVLAFVLAGLASGLFGAFLLVTRKKRMRDAIPFAPFLAGGGIAALFLGAAVLSIWLGI